MRLDNNGAILHQLTLLNTIHKCRFLIQLRVHLNLANGFHFIFAVWLLDCEL